MVEDLHATINSALREPDDAELDSAKARLADRGDFYLEAAAEHVVAFHGLTGKQVRQLTALRHYGVRHSWRHPPLVQLM